MDLDRALNHYFDQIEQSKVKSKPASQSKGSSSSTSASTSSSSLRSSSTPSARTRASRAAPVSLKVKQPRMQLASLAKRRKKQVSEDDEEDDADEKKGNNDSDDDSDNSDGDFKYASYLISPARSSRPSRTAKPTSFKPVKKTKSAATKKKTASASASSSSRPTKKQKKSLSDEEEDESEDSLFGHDSDDEEASLSKDDDSDDDDDDDDSDDDGFNMLPFMNILFRRRRPAAPRRRRVRVRSRSRADNSDDDDGDAPARGGGGGGWGRRRGGGARARVQALRTQFNTLVTPDVIAKQPEDDDPVRLRQVVTWNEPPPPINPIALGINFPDEYASRRRWNVGTLVDCDIGDGRGWERAKIVNILFAPRTNALSYDVTFENRRADIPPGVIFRFNATDEYHLANAYEHEDRFVAQPGDGMAKNGTKGGPAKKGASTAKKNNSAAAANAGPTKYAISDFRQYQLVDVKIGKRWFLGLVQGSRFSATPDGYADSQQHKAHCVDRRDNRPSFSLHNLCLSSVFF